MSEQGPQPNLSIIPPPLGRQDFGWRIRGCLPVVIGSTVEMKPSRKSPLPSLLIPVWGMIRMLVVAKNDQTRTRRQVRLACVLLRDPRHASFDHLLRACSRTVGMPRERQGFCRGETNALVVQTRRLLPGRPASRLLRFARNDSVSACHCEEYSDEAISVKARTGGNHLSGLHH